MSSVIRLALAAMLLLSTRCLAVGPGEEPAQPSEPRYGMELKEATIAMPDGVRLAADLYVPTGGSAGQSFPVLLEYLPYRKTEARGRNWPLYAYFVARGYIVARVDIRGTGNSEGMLVPYEDSDIEQQDGEVLIDWLSKQSWSTGKVGMFGISWGGFNSIQMAGRNPPALKAFIAVDATDDLYQEDVHFIDGIMHLDSWEMSPELDNARPGAPDYRIDDDNFRQRFDTPPWMLTWKRQQRDGAFWDRASWRDRQSKIIVPGFYIGGWYDGYRDVIPRALAQAGGPVKAMIGPWSHAFPNEPYPKPGMEWRHEAVRWFDHWLKGIDTGIMEEPRFAVYVRDWHPPGPYLETVPGRWRWEEGWPIDRVKDRVFSLRDSHTLGAPERERRSHMLRYVPSTGMEAGGPVMWWGDVAHDQRGTDARSDVVVAGCDICRERSQRIEGRFVAVLELHLHVFFDQLHGYVAWAFDHDLNVMLPSNLGKFAQGLELCKLCFVVRVEARARTQAIAEREAHVVGFHDFADFFKALVQEALFVMRETPLCHD